MTTENPPSADVEEEESMGAPTESLELAALEEAAEELEASEDSGDEAASEDASEGVP